MSKMRTTATVVLSLGLLVTLTACGQAMPTYTLPLLPAEPTSPLPTVPLTQTRPPFILSPAATLAHWPTRTPLPTSTPYFTPTPIPASQMRGEWRRITTDDGLCTNSPLFIGWYYIGTGTATSCYPTAPYDGTTWATRTEPIGTRVTAMGKFPPGGGELWATDQGVCWSLDHGQECQTLAEGYPYANIAQIANIGPERVLMLADSVVYREETYSIPEIVGAESASPTRMVVSGDRPYGPLPQIWVGTSEYGIVVVEPDTNAVMRYTTDNGLVSNTIRDIAAENCTRYCDFRDIWVATDSGVGHWNGERWSTYTIADGLPSNDVRGIMSSQRNTAWVATAGGAAYFDGQSWQAFTNEDGIPGEDLSGVRMYGDEVWFSTQGDGLLIFSIQTPRR